MQIRSANSSFAMEMTMEISGIRSVLPFVFQGAEKEAISHAAGDINDVRAPQILADEEVEGVFNETLGMIANDAAAALNVHANLSESRVFALIGA